MTKSKPLTVQQAVEEYRQAVDAMEALSEEIGCLNERLAEARHEMDGAREKASRAQANLIHVADGRDLRALERRALREIGR